jgi:hypothetical protein
MIADATALEVLGMSHISHTALGWIDPGVA